MPHRRPPYQVLGTEHAPIELAHAITKGPLVQMRNLDLRDRYPKLTPALDGLRRELETTSTGDWAALLEIKVKGYTYQSRVLVCIRQILGMFEDEEYDDDKFVSLPNAQDGERGHSRKRS